MNSFGDTTPIQAHAILRLLLRAGTLDRYTLIETMQALYGDALDWEAATQEYEEIAEEGEDTFDADDEDAPYEDEYDGVDVDLESIMDELATDWVDPASLPVHVKARLLNASTAAGESYRTYLLGSELLANRHRQYL